MLTYCLLLLPLCVLCWILVCNFLDLQRLAEEERDSCFTLSVFLQSLDCLCSVSLPRGSVG